MRKRRLLELIKQLKKESAGNKNLILGSVTKIKGSENNQTITVAEGIFNALKIYEGELAKIQAQIIKTAVELKKINDNAELLEEAAERVTINVDVE